MAVTKDEWVSVLQRAASHFEEQHDLAVAAEQWLAAYEKRLTGLIWRAAALSIDQGLIDHRINIGQPPTDFARLLLAELMRVVECLEPSQDETSKFRKAETAVDLLKALLHGVGVMEAWTGRDLREPPFIALQGFELGRAEVALSLAERGHWEQVAAWSNRRVGRDKGYREPWRVAIAPSLQGWIDDDPKATIKTLMLKMWKWIEEYAAHEKGFSPPDFESLRPAIKAMHKQGLIKHPRWA